MLRFVSIPIPPLTTEDTAILTEVDIDKGNIEDLIITFPDGCVGLVHVQVYCHGVQIAPYNPTGSIVGNNSRISVLRDFPVDQPPYTLIFKTWNEDDTYNHTLTVEVMVTGEKQPTQFDLLKGL